MLFLFCYQYFSEFRLIVLKNAEFLKSEFVNFAEGDLCEMIFIYKVCLKYNIFI